MKSLAYSPDFIFLLYFIYGAAECGIQREPSISGKIRTQGRMKEINCNNLVKLIKLVKRDLKNSDPNQ